MNELAKANDYKSELDYARDVGKMIVKTGKWSKDWNEDTVAVLVLYARDLGIHPVKALMNGFDIIQGKISMKPILMSDMIRRAGHSIQILHNDAVKCVLKGRRKDNGDECTITFGLEDAKKAGLTSKTSFQSWAADMLYNRAMGRLGRMLFSDVIGGAYTDGEVEDIKATSKQDKELEVMQVDIEATTVVHEKPAELARPPIESFTIDDLQKAMFSRHPVGKDVLRHFLQDFAESKGTSEDVIIRSALMSEPQLEKLCMAMIDWQAQPVPEETTEIVA